MQKKFVIAAVVIFLVAVAVGVVLGTTISSSLASALRLSESQTLKVAQAGVVFGIAISLILAGIVVNLIGGVVFLVAAFTEDLIWGFGCLFVPFCGFAFLITHWQEAKRGFLIQLAGSGYALLGGLCLFLI